MGKGNRILASILEVICFMVDCSRGKLYLIQPFQVYISNVQKYTELSII